MITFHRLNRHIRPIAIAILAVCLLTGALAGLVMAQEGGDTSEGTGEGAAPRSDVSACGSCHPDVVAAWQGGPHDMAYHDELFQQGWESQNFDPDCLDCHTTGYSPATQEYKAEGVTCEACHGEVPSGHPPAPVDLNVANQVCSGCHPITQAEFRASRHEVAGMLCTSCHYAHTNGLRKDTELQQCLNCHGGQLEGFVAHEAHIESGLSCRDCHGYVRPGLEIPPDGLGPTGHDFQENIVACLDCHEGIDLQPTNGEALAPEDEAEVAQDAGDITGRRATLRATELEAAVRTLTLQSRNETALRLLQGGAGGLVVGAVVVFLVSRRKNGNKSNGGEDDAEE